MISITRQTLGDLLRRTARRHPGKLAVRCGRVDWTYAEFDAICEPCGGRTGRARRGVRRPCRHPGPQFARLCRRAVCAGPPGRRARADQFHAERRGSPPFILEHSGAKLLCVDAGLTALVAVRPVRAPPSSSFSGCLREDESTPEAGLLTFAGLLASTATPRLPARPAGIVMLAQIVYTSGTESRPEGGDAHA